MTEEEKKAIEAENKENEKKILSEEKLASIAGGVDMYRNGEISDGCHLDYTAECIQRIP